MGFADARYARHHIEELQQNSETKQEDLPSLGISLLSVVLPIFFIAGNTVLTMAFDEKDASLSYFQRATFSIFQTVGDSNVALFTSAFVALILLWSRLKNVKTIQKIITESLMSAGMIVLIISAGGAFGQMLQQTGIGVKIGEMATGYRTMILPLAFLITVVVRTAQGSATVAMVTTIGVMKGFSNAEALGFHPVYLALVIGCGSKIFAWMNDSAFWIITKMTGMEEKETIRHFSYMLAVMGFAGLVAVVILSKIFPMI